jgi:hypothetical protein
MEGYLWTGKKGTMQKCKPTKLRMSVMSDSANAKKCVREPPNTPDMTEMHGQTVNGSDRLIHYKQHYKSLRLLAYTSTHSLPLLMNLSSIMVTSVKTKRQM